MPVTIVVYVVLSRIDLSVIHIIGIITVEVVRSLEAVSTVKILNKEVGEVVNLVVCSESKGMITCIPGKVVLDSPDVLVERVCHRRALITEVQGTATNSRDRDIWERGAYITLITDTDVAYTRLITDGRRDSALQFTDPRVSYALERITVEIVIERADTTAIVQLLGVNKAPTDGKLIELIDVPVELYACLMALCINILGRESTRISSSLLIGYLL